ncbi:sulfur oxidation c-type cytochrome SoxX [Hoeflea sp. TYP-13]|uniref:sulfur oxidation c-type cytochrome SoxX n=1 Tax=Hoeflea sp. TYP-13 TaxID=3230023 RepID=UPI0034C61248
MSVRSILSRALLITALPTFAFAGSVNPDDVVFKDDVVAVSLTGTAGDPAKGREIFANRKLGNCLACHINADLNEQLFHGEVGPPLDGVADRWEEPELRAIMINSKVVFGDETIMPSFYRLKNGVRTAEKFQGKTILTAEQVEDVIAYLRTLKE